MALDHNLDPCLIDETQTDAKLFEFLSMEKCNCCPITRQHNIRSIYVARIAPSLVKRLAPVAELGLKSDEFVAVGKRENVGAARAVVELLKGTPRFPWCSVAH